MACAAIGDEEFPVTLASEAEKPNSTPTKKKRQAAAPALDEPEPITDLYPFSPTPQKLKRTKGPIELTKRGPKRKDGKNIINTPTHLSQNYSQLTNESPSGD